MSIPAEQEPSTLESHSEGVSHEQEKKFTYTTPKRSQTHRSRPFDQDSVNYNALQDISNSLMGVPSLERDPAQLVQTLHHHASLDRILSEEDKDEWVKSKISLIRSIHDNIVGGEAVFKTPFSRNRFLPITYADYIASGKPLKFIEDYLFEQVLPTYANTHTTSSFTGFQTTHFREEAREIIAGCVNAKLKKKVTSHCSMCSIPDVKEDSNDDDCDVVLFEGSGSTSAINTIVHCIGVRERVLLARSQAEIPVIFISPYEHHSNILPWRESGALVVQISEDKYGNLNIQDLKKCLETYKNSGRLLIGSFSAASNVTGVITDCDAVCKLCHENGALCFFDYAASAPYVPIDMNPTDDPLLHKDAIFISPHKFVGGPGTPGILVAKRKLFKNGM